jgi:hypothetical protein
VGTNAFISHYSGVFFKHKDWNIQLPLKSVPLTLSMIPNVVVKWLTLLLCIRQVLGSNLSPETSYPEVLYGFLQSLQANAEIVPSMAIFFHILSILSFTYHPFIQWYIVLSRGIFVMERA